MKSVVDLILLLLAAVCFVLAAFGVTSPRIHLGWMGAFFFALVPLLAAMS